MTSTLTRKELKTGRKFPLAEKNCENDAFKNPIVLDLLAEVLKTEKTANKQN